MCYISFTLTTVVFQTRSWWCEVLPGDKSKKGKKSYFACNFGSERWCFAASWVLLQWGPLRNIAVGSCNASSGGNKGVWRQQRLKFCSNTLMGFRWFHCLLCTAPLLEVGVFSYVVLLLQAYLLPLCFQHICIGIHYLKPLFFTLFDTLQSHKFQQKKKNTKRPRRYVTQVCTLPKDFPRKWKRQYDKDIPYS